MVIMMMVMMVMVMVMVVVVVVMIVVITSGGPDKYINIWQVGRGMFVANLHMWQGISHLRNRWEMEAFGETSN